MNAGLTQVELAERQYAYRGNIARLERGRTEATVRTLKRIATATGHRLLISENGKQGIARDERSASQFDF